MSGRETRFVDAAGLRLCAVLEGSGTPVLVLHGFTGDAESMEPVALGLRDRHRVIRLELVGHGRSEAPETLAPYAMRACVEQVAAAIRALGYEQLHVIGYSMGGRVALATAVAHPELFDRIVLVGASAGIVDSGDREQRIDSDRALADRIESLGIERFVDEWMALPLFASQARLGREELARARRQRLRNRAPALARSLRGMGTGAQAPLEEWLPGLDRPVMLVVGEEDAKFRAIAARLKSLLPDARTSVVPEAGHAVHLEAPVAFAELVADFFSQVGETRDRVADRGGSV